KAAKFDLLEFRVLGNSVLESTEVERIVYPFLGSMKSVDDVQAARLALENAYHAKGYGTVFVDVPEQSVDQGIVRLKVTEGKRASCWVSGARYFSQRQIRNEAPEAAPGAVLHIPTLQTELEQINTQTRDRSVVPVLKAGSAPGTVDLAFKVDDRLPLHAG